MSQCPGMQYALVMNRSRSCTGAGLTYSLMLHEPAMMHRRSLSVMPLAIAHELMSNRPPATGVPSFSPVASAADRLTRPQMPADRRNGGNLSSRPASPNDE